MAAAAIGGKTAQLSVAFGKRAPMYDPAWNVKVKSCPYAHIYIYIYIYICDDCTVDCSDCFSTACLCSTCVLTRLLQRQAVERQSIQFNVLLNPG